MAQTFAQTLTQPGSFLDPNSQSDPLTTPLGKPSKPQELPHQIAQTSDTTPMWDPDREAIVDVPKNYADHLLATGYTFPDGSAPIVGEQNVKNEKFDSSAAGALYLASHNFINQTLMGLPDLALNTALNPEGRKQYNEQLENITNKHPYLGGLTNILGIINPATGGPLVHLGEKVLGRGIEKGVAKVLTNKAEGRLAEAAVAGVKGVGNLAAKGTGIATDAAIRGGIDEASNQKSYDHPLDVEKIFIAGAKDFGWGLGTGAAFEGAFGALRVARKGISKTTDYVAEKWPTKQVNVKGPKELGPLEIKGKTLEFKKVATKFGKTRGKETIGGGFEKGSTVAKHKFNEDTLEQTSTQSSFVNQDETLKESKHRTPDMLTQEKTWNEPNPDAQKSNDVASGKDAVGGPERRETGIVFKDGMDQEDYEAGVKKGLDNLVKNNDFHKELSDYVFDAEHRISNWRAKKGETGFLTEGEMSDLDLAHKQKDAAQDFLRKRYPGDETTPSYQDWLDEYFNVKNGLHERITEKEAKVDPRFKVRKVKEKFEKGHEDSAFEHSHQNDFTSGEDTSSSKKRTVNNNSSEDKTAFHKKFDENVKTTEGGQDAYEYAPFEKIRFAPSRISRKEHKFIPLIPYGIRTPLMYAAGGVGYLTGGVVGTVAAGSAFALDTGIAAALNNRAAVSNYFDRATKPFVKAAANTLKSYLRSNQVSDKTDHNPVKVDQYPIAINNLQRLSNPDVATQAVQHAIEPIAHHYPALQAQLIQKNIQAAQALQPFVPKDTRAPALRNAPFEPSRSQKVKFLKMYDAITRPIEVMRNPSPAQMQVIEKHVPAHVDLFRQAISGALINNPKQVSDRKQTQLSVAMGSAYTPRQDPKYMQRLQMTAHIDETQKTPPPSPSGSKGGKVTQQAVTLDAPPNILNQLA